MLVRIAQSQKLVHNAALDRFEYRSDAIPVTRNCSRKIAKEKEN
jgi:hypothetical protein